MKGRDAVSLLANALTSPSALQGMQLGVRGTFLGAGLGSFSFFGAASLAAPSAFAPVSFLGGVNFMGCSHSLASPSTAANAGWCASVSHQRVTCG